MAPLAAWFFALVLEANPNAPETHWGGPAWLVYDTGFAEHVRKRPGGKVGLFDMELVENDAPGAGLSEKGICSDIVWGSHRARKVLHLNDPRAHRAFVVIFTYTESPAHPLTFSVNGRAGQITKVNRETYRWAEFPVEVLSAGDNVIELSCPQAKTEAEGWPTYRRRCAEGSLAAQPLIT